MAPQAGWRRLNEGRRGPDDCGRERPSLGWGRGTGSDRDGVPPSEWAGRGESHLDALEAFNRDAVTGVTAGPSEVHKDMHMRWDFFRRGLQALLQSNEEMGLPSDAAAERTEAWVMAAVHRMFAAPLSAVMSHSEASTGAEKKRHAETASVLSALFKSGVTSVPPLPAKPEDMSGPSWRPAPIDEILQVAQTSQCFRCGAKDATGKHFTAACGATYDADRNSLQFKRPGVAGSRQGSMGGPDSGMGGLRGGGEQLTLSLTDVKSLFESMRDDRAHEERLPPPPQAGRERERSLPPAAEGRSRGREGSRSYAAAAGHPRLGRRQ